MDDPDLQQLLKQAQEMQRTATQSGSPDTRKNLPIWKRWQRGSGATRAGGKGREGKITGCAQETARCARPGRVPDWMPATPEFKPAGKPTKKLVDEQVKNRSDWHLVTHSGANGGKLAIGSSRAANRISNQSLNNMNVNGKITRILFSARAPIPGQEVELEASREPDSKVTQVEISSPLPKPDIESE